MIGATALTPRLQRIGVPDRLVIADGTDYRTVVLDVRELGPWSVTSDVSMDRPRLIVYHHTVSAPITLSGRQQQLARLQMEASTARYGLPYNFVVMPVHPYNIYYLNDVDQAWPHTLGWNHATAIAAFGNYEADEPPAAMVRRMLRLADALATMWGVYVPEKQHRDLFATLCPGKYLSPLLRR